MTNLLFTKAVLVTGYNGLTGHVVAVEEVALVLEGGQVPPGARRHRVHPAAAPGRPAAPVAAGGPRGLRVVGDVGHLCGRGGGVLLENGVECIDLVVTC